MSGRFSAAGWHAGLWFAAVLGRQLRDRFPAAAPPLLMGVAAIGWSIWTLLDHDHVGTGLGRFPPEFGLILGVIVIGLALAELLFGLPRRRK